MPSAATGVDAPDTHGPTVPDAVTMPLLDRIVQQSLDEDYQVVAARKARSRRGRGPARPPASPAKSSPSAGRPRQVAAAVMAVFGVLVAVAAVQTSRNAPEVSAGRESLIQQVQDRRATVMRLQDKVDRLQSSTTTVRAGLAQAGQDEQALTAKISRLEARTGFGAVTGPGVRITVDDAPGGDVTQVVRDSDLATLVDGLWHAGAEAISVNGRRLTALTAFRNVGPAIHIGITPLVPPYTLLVVGNPDTLAANLLDSTFGQEWYSLKDSLGFVYEIKSDDSLSLPASRMRNLRSVQLLTDDAKVPRPGQEGGVSDAMIAALGLLVGVVLGLIFQPNVPNGLEPYLPIAVVAALDAVFGGLRAYLDGIFDDKVFVVSFVSNVVIAATIVYLGDQLGVGGQLSTGVIVVLGIRIFSNVAAIRRHLFHA